MTTTVSRLAVLTTLAAIAIPLATGCASQVDPEKATSQSDNLYCLDCGGTGGGDPVNVYDSNTVCDYAYKTGSVFKGESLSTVSTPNWSSAKANKDSYLRGQCTTTLKNLGCKRVGASTTLPADFAHAAYLDGSTADLLTQCPKGTVANLKAAGTAAYWQWGTWPNYQGAVWYNNAWANFDGWNYQGGALWNGSWQWIGWQGTSTWTGWVYAPPPCTDASVGLDTGWGGDCKVYPATGYELVLVDPTCGNACR